MWLINIGAEIDCRSKWQHSGFEFRYSFLGGCLIQTKPDIWIPAEAYREITP